jgi:hypothetical protein
MSILVITGGCQCGALRYGLKSFGRASICHCRMCQKAFGNFFAPLVEALGFEWLRGTPSLYASSNISNRGFCSHCGTPVTLETDGEIELAIGTLDNPSQVIPDYHCNLTDQVSAAANLGAIPNASPKQKRDNDEWNAAIISYQHPDHPTENWEVK